MNAHAAAGIGHNSLAVGEMVKEDPALVFRDDATLPALLKEIDGEIAALAIDLETDSGRKAIASLAYSISRRKTPILDAGKSLTEDWRKKTAAVNALKTKVEDEFDARRDKAREPLTAWETAEKTREDRVASALVAFSNLPAVSATASVADIERIIAQVEAIVVDEAFRDSKDRADAAKADALSKLRESAAAIKRADEDRAELARLRAAQEERERTEREAEQQRQAEAAERERIAQAEQRAAADAEARVRAERDAEDARVKAEQDAALAAERQKAAEAQAALEAEQQRQRDAKEAEARRADEQAAEDARRAADTAHRGTIMRAAKEALMTHASVDEPTAKDIVRAIVAGSIPSVTLKF